jgi:hypothetical protein
MGCRRKQFSCGKLFRDCVLTQGSAETAPPCADICRPFRAGAAGSGRVNRHETRMNSRTVLLRMLSNGTLALATPTLPTRIQTRAPAGRRVGGFFPDSPLHMCHHVLVGASAYAQSRHHACGGALRINFQREARMPAELAIWFIAFSLQSRPYPLTQSFEGSTNH